MECEQREQQDKPFSIDPVWAGSVRNSLAGAELWDFESLKIPRLWNLYGVRGQKVNVYVIDTGISRHPSFAHSSRLRKFSFAGDNDPYDGNGHGSWCCGKIGAMGVGIAPECSLTSLKALDNSGRGRSSWIDEALEFINNEPDPHIVNMSLGSTRPSARQERLIKRLYDKGCIVVAAAGNSNTSKPSYPAAYESALAVAALDKGDHRAGFSNYGDHIVVAAPGVSCYSVFKSGYRKLQGTSMASPVAAGLLVLGASLLLRKNPATGRATMRDVLIGSLKETAVDLGVPGRDRLYGFGGVNGIKFMEAVNRI